MVKSNKKSSEKAAEDFFKDNVIKRKVEEQNRQKQELLQQEEEKRKQRENTALEYIFNVGERVFHEKLGVGHIVDVLPVGESIMYTIDFGKMGKKAMDAYYAKLKKF